MGHEHFLNSTGRHEHFLNSTGRHEHFLNSTGRHEHFLNSTGRHEHFLNLTCKIRTPRQGPQCRDQENGVERVHTEESDVLPFISLKGTNMHHSGHI